MPKKIIERFKIEYLSILRENGGCDENLRPKFKKGELKRMYELMVLTRSFDEKSIKLQRQGRIGTYPPVRGQEAQVGAALAINKEDWIFPAFREQGVYIAKGMPMHMLFQAWKGDERGMKIPEDINMFTISIPVGSQLLHATGYAWAAKMQKKKISVLTFFGDGATSEGDVHEAMNFAGVYKLPVVFICQNNQYAISVPVSKQTASETIAQKAIAYGFEGIKVDGNDIFAVYKAVKEASDKAKRGKGPTLIEMFTYRMGDHTTSDDAKKYRNLRKLKEWELKDPILRLERYLRKREILKSHDIKEIKEKSDELVNKAVEESEKIAPQKPSEMFKYIYKEMDEDLKKQMESIK